MVYTPRRWCNYSPVPKITPVWLQFHEQMCPSLSQCYTAEHSSLAQAPKWCGNVCVTERNLQLPYSIHSPGNRHAPNISGTPYQSRNWHTNKINHRNQWGGEKTQKTPTIPSTPTTFPQCSTEYILHSVEARESSAQAPWSNQKAAAPGIYRSIICASSLLFLMALKKTEEKQLFPLALQSFLMQASCYFF